jgi:hypothetical protein
MEAGTRATHANNRGCSRWFAAVGGRASQRRWSSGSVGHGFRFCSKRDARANPRPNIWLGIDTEGSVYLGDSFSHAYEP